MEGDASALPRYRIFIGSSSEGLKVAQYLQVALADDYNATIWNQGVFGLSQNFWEGLIEACKQFDFAVFILTPDDMLTKQNNLTVARESILFQIGFFMGDLGRERTFIVYCEDDQIGFPRELIGITLATFKKNANMQSAMTFPAVAIRETIEKVAKKKGSREDIQNAFWELSDHYSAVNDLKRIHHWLTDLESPVDVLVKWFGSPLAPTRREEPLANEFIMIIQDYWKPIHERFLVLQFFSAEEPHSMASGNINAFTQLQALFKARDDFEATLKEPKPSGLYSLTMEISSGCSSLLTIIDELMIRRFDQIDNLKDRLTRSTHDG